MPRTVVVFLSGALSAVLLILLCLVLRGAQVRPAGKWEARMTGVAKHWILVRGRSKVNPLTASAQNIADGREKFSHYCFVCHGFDGQGTGVPFFETASPPIPSLASAKVQSYSDGQIYWIIKNGLWPSGMPASQGILNEDEMWSLVLYIRHLPPGGSLGEPCFYTGECSAPDPPAPAK
jgi:mono/diheme cytochrome c family protein